MRIRIFRNREQGQSLVEVAFALPILFVLVIGIVELGNALNAYNQVINASREGARFGSMGGSDTAVRTIVEGATAQMANLTGNSDLYVVRAELTGTAPSCSVISDTFSCSAVLNTGNLETTCVSPGELMARLDTQGIQDCDLDIVAVDLYYRSPSLLGLPLVKQLSEAVPMRSLTVMRMETPRPLSAICNVYPIAVHRSNFSGLASGQLTGDIWNGTDLGNFGWLRWPIDPSGGSSQTLAEALSRPTSSEFQNPADPSDTHLSVDDWICANTGVQSDSKVKKALNNLMQKGWFRIVVWDSHTDDLSGSNSAYHAWNFAIVELVDYDLDQKTIRVRFIAFDSTGCVE